MFSIKEAYELILQERIQITDHAMKRMTERDIDIKGDIIPMLLHGEVIEEYPDDYPYGSCLISGSTANKQPLHVVCAIGDGLLWIITAYFPNEREWENDYKTRKKGSL